MLITKVELRNVKNHTEADFSFQPGIIAICGPNGAGKTTILEAIAWALFDHLDYKRDDFIRRGAKRGQVSVAFKSDLDGREYVVSRDTGGGYSVYDPITKTKLVEQKNQVVPWLQKHIGVEPGTDLSALFKTTIGVPQGAFTYDFTLAPANRKAVFDQILKVEEYRRASDNLRDTLRHIDSRIIEADKKLAEAEGELKSYDETRREHDDAAARVASLDAELVEVNGERDRMAVEAERLDKLAARIETQHGAIERLNVKLEFTRDSLGVAREAAEQARTAAKIVAAVEAGYARYAAAAGRLAELERQRVERDEARGRIAAIERTLIEVRSQARMIEEKLTEIAAAREDLAALSGRVVEQRDLEARIAQLREERGELQSLRRALDPLDRELERLRQRYAALQKQVESAESGRERAGNAESLERERTELDAQVHQAELAIGNRRLRREQIEALRKDCSRMAAEIGRRQGEIERLEPLVPLGERLSTAEERHQANVSRLARLRAEVARDEEMIRALDQGAVCPLLSEKCLNLKPDESLDSRFRSGLTARHNEIGELERLELTLAEEMKQARAAGAEITRLPHLQTELARLSQELAAKGEQVAAIEAADAAGEEIDLPQLKKRRAEIERLMRQAHEAAILLGQADSLRAEMDELRREGETKRFDRDALEQRIAKIGEVESLIASAEEELRRLDDPRGRVAALERLIAREAGLQSEMAARQQQSAAVHADLEAALVGFEIFAALESEILAVNQTRAACEADYHAFIQNQKIAVTVAAREQDVAEISAEISTTEQSLAEIGEELRGLLEEYDATRHRALLARLDQWRERSTQLAAQLDHQRESFVRLQARLARLNEVRERMREQLAERDRARNLKETADFIREILQKAAPYITESYLFSISAEANQLYRDITGRYDVTLRWNREYEITLEEEGRERPFLLLSGGEQMAAALSVRLALLKELSDINLAFFDEPTTNMDEERRRNLAQQVGRIKDFHQLFVISHDDSFEGYTDQIIMLGS
ncbi:MAG: SMC family ATPase [Blastocatellia bacterium]|nr:SMC family ATPase [Blastocatellia bacterium]